MIKGLKALFAEKGIDKDYFFKEKDIFRYDLWYKGAEYSISLEQFRNTDLLDIGLLHFLKDVRVNRHVYMDFDRFIGTFDEIETDVLSNRTLDFAKKVRELWSRLQKAGEEGQTHD